MNFAYLVCNNKIIRQEIKYLGIFIDSNVSWKSQVDCITKKKEELGFFLNFVMLILQFLFIYITH